VSKIAISILNWNGLELTTRCVQGLLDQAVPADIYILDNGSAQNEADKLRERFGDAVQIERSDHNLGFSGGNNYWIERLVNQYDSILLLNQDTVITSDIVTPLAQALDQDARAAAVGPTGAKISLWTGKVVRDQGSDCVVGYCILLSSSALKQVGWLEDQYFAYYEEADWCMRARKAGWHCVVVPLAGIVHEQNHRFRTNYIARNMVWFMKRFASPAQLIFFFGYYFTVFWIERLRKGSSPHDLVHAAQAGWFHRLPKLY
jgi:GT2 family glycosyltransferase